MSVIEVKSAAELETHTAKGGSFGGAKPCIIDFSASWCGPCKAIAPAFEALAAKHPNVTFLKVDVDELPDAAQQYGVTGMPTFVGLVAGEKVGEVVGADPRKLTALVEDLASRASAVQGAGQRLGGGEGAAAGQASGSGDAGEMRARMAAAAEARLKALQG